MGKREDEDQTDLEKLYGITDPGELAGLLSFALNASLTPALADLVELLRTPSPGYAVPSDSWAPRTVTVPLASASGQWVQLVPKQLDRLIVQLSAAGDATHGFLFARAEDVESETAGFRFDAGQTMDLATRAPIYVARASGPLTISAAVHTIDPDRS